MAEARRCPKCGGEMGGDKCLASYTEISLKKENEFLGERVLVFYCLSCGYIELYRGVGARE